MINKTLKFIRDQVNEYLRFYLGLNDNDSRVVLSNLVDNNESDNDEIPQDKVLLSLVHIEEERAFKAQDAHIRKKDTAYRANPEMKFNLYVLFGANYTTKNYEEGLKSLSGVIACFQGRNFFEPNNYPGLDTSIYRIVLDLYTPSMEQASQMWQAMGGKFIPSVLYKVRIVVINDNRPHFEVPRIEQIDAES